MKTYTIKNKYQKIEILNYGATIRKWEAYNDNTNIVISNENLNDYLDPNNGFLSSTIGRVANRIKDGKFKLDSKVYNLEKNFDNINHGHGGTFGFHSKKFELIKHTNTKIVLKLISKHMEAGYPGNLTLYVTYELIDNKMILSYEAETDLKTIVNITNHAYFNLSNESNVLNHSISANTYKTLETNDTLIPTGIILDNSEGVLDLRTEKKLDIIINDSNIQRKSLGLDHFFLFNKKDRTFSLKYKNRELNIKTTYPGMQIYTFQHAVKQPLLNRSYSKYGGIAVECQYEPDAINNSNFSSIILNKGDKYKESITYTLIEY